MKFEQAVALTIAEEGPYTIEKDGSISKCGINSKYYPEVLKPDFGPQRATLIFEADYWSKLRCDELQPFLRFTVFECGVNQGQPTAAELLQQALQVRVDRVLGPVTMAAAAKATKATLVEFNARRAGLYAHTDGFPIQGLGWLRRLFRCDAACALYLPAVS